MKYISGKRYGHEQGLSCTFRQWRAESHCRLLHGYALAFTFTFGSDELDVRNWVVDFGSMKSLKGELERQFDHVLLVAEDDPKIDILTMLEQEGVARVNVVPASGCEAIAAMIWELGDGWLQSNGYKPRVQLLSVKVEEHGANFAEYRP
jgi:6-pyruvoyltetrahydropterin/6-carboxytetrahydropterin synthase